MAQYRYSRNQEGGGLFDVKKGLWWRDKNFVPPYKEKDGADCCWSRGNGWVYAALVRVMQELDPKDPYYKELKNDFLLMSEGLLKWQREDGLWNASLVSKEWAGKEISGTSLFIYGMAWGIQNGLLKAKKYRPVIDKAWKTIATECVHADGFLGFVQGTGAGPADSQPVTYDKAPDFEDYGTGCFLLGAVEYYKLLKK
jgi:rhamnogalacturonyl hydrolase YesR